MKHWGLTCMKMVSISIFLCIGCFGWMNIIILFIQREWQTDLLGWIGLGLLIWYTLILLTLQIIHNELHCRIDDRVKLAFFIWFVGIGHFGLLHFIQDQQSTVLTLLFHAFAIIPILLALTYGLIVRKYSNQS
ncbi:hypothetical protein ACVNRM_23620 [Bacillus paranthracis]|uniref:hypothetical protein n=1 Tax=Bacilli TaxID=91061 RepID=UPI0005DDBE1B|nr:MULTISPECIES: hypothetical protein [Bacillus]KXI52687.1 hypothetical protein ACS45_09950 [Bacillus cereus]MCW4577731.1 hypothetical protein [Bacillus pacificus]CKE77451.1 Uncharacterised protein [Streptococcus pneumoniae]KAB7632163.1 hypothetical protein GBN96_26080 [Bacillus sp. B4-WWTP-NA-D-NA-NA]KYQ03697.1 hypothetical protein B4079_1107 [Bacillus cereus]